MPALLPTRKEISLPGNRNRQPVMCDRVSAHATKGDNLIETLAPSQLFFFTANFALSSEALGHVVNRTYAPLDTPARQYVLYCERAKEMKHLLLCPFVATKRVLWDILNIY